ncbi:hypothetical protein GCM10009827_119010 [Dactylosporangium maewongense]|uniref:Uncharacterized protein n=1 Tax=Dactylosporangium maewongense TaxID=634393 RepID=A0ABN2DHP2_9ACTN
MFRTPPPPPLPAGGDRHQIPDRRDRSEPGALTFGRDISHNLTDLLGIPVDPPVLVHGDDLSGTQVFGYDLTVAGLPARITVFPVRDPLLHTTLPGYSIELPGQRVPFDPDGYRDLDWQLATTLAAAVHTRTASAATQPDSAQPLPADGVVITDPAAFEARIAAALAEGPVRVDRPVTGDGDCAELCVIGADGVLFCLLYQPDSGQAWVRAVGEVGGPLAELTGAGCPGGGFRLTGDLPYRVHALLRGAHRGLRVVRGARTAFDEVGLP